MDFPADHRIIQSGRVELEWTGERWVIPASARLREDPEPPVCTYGLHLDDPAMGARCRAEVDRAREAPVPPRAAVVEAFSRPAQGEDAVL